MRMKSKSGGTIGLKQIGELARQGQLAKAKSACSKLCSEHPKNSEAWFLLGSICGHLSEYGEMENHIRKSISINPGNVGAHFNLGVALLAQGQLDNAGDSFKHTIKLKPNHEAARYQYAKLLWQQGKLHAAAAEYATAIAYSPDTYKLHYELGCLWRKLYEYEKSEASFKKALTIDPVATDLYKLLHNTLYDQGKFTEAKDCCKNILALKQDDGTRIRMNTMIPVIMDSAEHIITSRQTLLENINLLLKEDLHVNDPISEIGYTSFQLAYHGKNNNVLQKKLAELYLHACPSLSYTAKLGCLTENSHAEKPVKIGFISRYLRNHSIGKAGRGLICNLSPEQFETTALFLEPPEDSTANAIQAYATHSVQLEASLQVARKQIENCNLDILFYQDIGMDPFTYFLAFSRLAPVQCTYFGHPDTTGIPNMDYFISTDFYESDGSLDHYSEKLITLKNVAAVSYCYKPEAPLKKNDRAYFNIDENAHVYLCPQTLFKFHPEFDAILGDILRNDPEGILVLKSGTKPHLAKILQQRLSKSIPDVIDRVRFISHQSYNDYMSLISVSDIMLDTIHFGGFTTTLDALAMEIPVISWPSPMMKSRHTASIFHKIGIEECIANSADNYIKKANRIACDNEHRDNIIRKIRENSRLVWEEGRLIKEFENAFLTMHSEQQLHNQK